MLELDQVWFPVLIANFLVLVFVLNKILFQPVLTLFKERKSAIDGSLAIADELQKKKEEGFERLQKELSEARGKAKEAYAALRNEGLEKQKEILGAAHEEALKAIEDARKKLQNEASRAKDALSAEVEKYSEEIVNKLVKV